MLRTVFTIGLFAVLGVIALRLVFGVFGTLMGLFLWLLGKAIFVLLVGLVIYAIVRLVSPDTARRWRERFSGDV
jgi:predicted membrane channel-forming protein YqfA (hemolysin III family)